MKNLLAVLFLLASPLFILAQNIGGLWYGTLKNDSTKRIQEYELGLSEYRGKITGYTYTTFIENDTFYYSIKKVKAERKGNTLVVEDIEMVANNFPVKAAKGVRQTAVFPLINDSTIDISNGTWSTNQTKKYYSIGGTVDMRIQKEAKQSSMLSHLQEMKVNTDMIAKNTEKKDEPVAKNNNPAIYAKEQPKKNEPVLASNKPAQNTGTTSSKPVIEKNTVTAAPGTEEKKEVVTANKTNNSSVNKPSDVKANHTIANNSQVQQPKPENPPGSMITKNNASLTSSVQPNTNKPVTENKTEPKPEEKKPDVTASERISNPTMQKTNNISVVNASPSVNEKKGAEKAFKLPDLVAERKTMEMAPVYFKNDSLILSLYDNGVVDGDTVSVFLNGESIIARQKLKEAATKKTIYITPATDSIQLVLFAENLGTIPPNTGLLTIRDGDELYQVRFSADLKQNAAVTLRRRR